MAQLRTLEENCLSALTWFVELHQVVDDDVRHPEILIINIISLAKRALRDLSLQTTFRNSVYCVALGYKVDSLWKDPSTDII